MDLAAEAAAEAHQEDVEVEEVIIITLIEKLNQFRHKVNVVY